MVARFKTVFHDNILGIYWEAQFMICTPSKCKSKTNARLLHRFVLKKIGGKDCQNNQKNVVNSIRVGGRNRY